MFAVPSFFGYNTTFVNGPVATAATGVGETSFTANWNAFTGATYYLLDVSTSPSFSSFVLQDEFTTSTSYVVIGLTASTTYYYRVRANVGVDPDAQAFFDRVTTAGGTLSATEQTATNQLVLDMKAAGVWTKMKAVYPMVGASAAACSRNLKSDTFNGTFTSGWTFASTGVTGNGSSSYMDTTFQRSVSASLNSFHLSYYSRTNNLSGNHILIGGGGTSDAIISANFAGSNLVAMNDASVLNAALSNSLGLILGKRENSSQVKTFQNGSLLVTASSTSTSLGSSNLWLNGYNPAGFFAPHESAFASIGDGLTDTEASNLYTAVQTFNQTLSRSVGPQIVSDADAQAYINRVYTAGGTLTNTEANAVNQLTIDMKAAGIWTAMKAVYPMVGSSAAACAQNLKSSSFTGSFSSGWTFASTGVTGNGTSAYMDTNFNPNTSSNVNSKHISYYSRNNFDFCQIGISSSGYDQIYYVGGAYYNILSTTSFNQITTATTNGFVLASRTTSVGGTTTYVNNSNLGNDGLTSTTNPIGNLYINARNEVPSVGGFSPNQCAFASIGDGLTSTQASNFYTAVQAFQTTLARQV